MNRNGAGVQASLRRKDSLIKTSSIDLPFPLLSLSLSLTLFIWRSQDEERLAWPCHRKNTIARITFVALWTARQRTKKKAAQTRERERERKSVTYTWSQTMVLSQYEAFWLFERGRRRRRKEIPKVFVVHSCLEQHSITGNFWRHSIQLDFFSHDYGDRPRSSQDIAWSLPRKISEKERTSFAQHAIDPSESFSRSIYPSDRTDGVIFHVIANRVDKQQSADV